jgi:predicted nucleotide-binding protein
LVTTTGDAPKVRGRARQNVVFEHGFLIGKLGRNCVTAFIKGDVEPPSDISGVVYVSMSADGGWKKELVTEMKAAGYLPGVTSKKA